MVIYDACPAGAQRYARVVELADSLDSGSSVHYARAGSSPASRTIKIPTPSGVVIFMDTEGDFTCSGQVNCPCAKVLDQRPKTLVRRISAAAQKGR